MKKMIEKFKPKEVMLKVYCLGLTAVLYADSGGNSIDYYLDRLRQLLTDKKIVIPVITIMAAVGVYELMFSKRKGASTLLYAVVGGIILLTIIQLINRVFGTGGK